MDSWQAPHIFDKSNKIKQEKFFLRAFNPHAYILYIRRFHLLSVVLHASNHFGIFRHCEASCPSPKQSVCLERCCARSVHRRTFWAAGDNNIKCWPLYASFWATFNTIRSKKSATIPCCTESVWKVKWMRFRRFRQGEFLLICQHHGFDRRRRFWPCLVQVQVCLDRRPGPDQMLQDPRLRTMSMLYVSLERNASVLAGEKPGYDSGIPMPLSATRSDIQKYKKHVNGTDSWNQSQGP